MTPRATTPDFHYDPRKLIPQWDPDTKRMVSMHPAPPATPGHGPTETRMGTTLASAQEMCRLANIALVHANRHRPVRREDTA